MKIGVFIPCHLNSIRFPKKILTKIYKIEMIEHVRRRALLSSIKETYIVTNSNIISNIVKAYSGKVLLSKKKHYDGSSRVEEVIRDLDYEKILLLQGDEPLIFPSYLDKLKSSPFFNNNTVLNLASKCNNDDLTDINIVKCIVNKKDDVISLFRFKNKNSGINKNKIFKILGTILYPKKVLLDLNKYPPNLNKKEKDLSIEQIKILKKGYKLKIVKVNKATLSLNTPNDKIDIVKFINKSKIQQKLLKKIGIQKI